MMRYTENYNLKKPEELDPVDIQDLNYNADAIDGKLKEIEDWEAAHLQASNPHSITPALIGAETPTGAQQKANQAETNAKSYADIVANNALNSAKNYADAVAQQKANQAETNAKSYANIVANNALNSAKNYADAVAQQKANQAETNAKSYANIVANNALNSAKDYADDVLESANSHTDQVASDLSQKVDETRIKVLDVEQDVSNISKVLTNLNPGQEAKQSVSGYGILSLPKNAANGQVSLVVKGRTNNSGVCVVGGKIEIFGEEDDMYGIEVDIPNNKFTRLAGAANKTAGADFDNINAYKRRRCILADDTTVLAYHGEPGYTETGILAEEIIKNDITYPVGTHVQVMVEQPKFYYKRVPLIIEPIQDGIGFHLRKWRDYISDYARPGFKLHPNFLRNGVEYDYIYYPAFEGSVFDVSENAYLLADEQVANFTVSTGDKLCSIANAKPVSGLSQSLTLPNSRILANNRGEGWQLIDMVAQSAEQMIMMIELGTSDAQTAIGLGVVNKASGEGNESEITGGTSYLGNATGGAVGTNGLVSVSYRGRENSWGNIWKWYDGFNIEAKGIHEAYWANHSYASNIKTEPYKNCGFTLAKSNGYVSAVGYSEECDFMYIPTETVGASSRPLHDYFYQNAAYTGFLVARVGGAWNNSLYAGPWCLTVSSSSGVRYRYIGAALLCMQK